MSTQNTYTEDTHEIPSRFYFIYSFFKKKTFTYFKYKKTREFLIFFKVLYYSTLVVHTV